MKCTLSLSNSEELNQPVKTISAPWPSAKKYLLVNADHKMYESGSNGCLEQTFEGSGCSMLRFDLFSNSNKQWTFSIGNARCSLVFVMNAGIKVKANNQQHFLAQGFTGLLNLAGLSTLHIECTASYTRLLFVNFSQEFTEQQGFVSRELLSLLDEDKNAIAACSGKISKCIFLQLDTITSFNGLRVFFPTYIAARATDILIDFLETRSYPNHPPVDKMERVAEAKRMIDQHNGEKLTVNEIGRRVGLSRRDLQRGFNDLLGTTMDKYQADVRFQKAAELLLSYPSMSVYEIGCKVGYAEESSFIKAFRNRYNTTPLRFRKMSP